MNTEFSLLNRRLTLIRYPVEHQHKSLQAWDSADELLIEHLSADTTHPDIGKYIIFNDDFGALGCWFAHHAPYWVSDSLIAHRSLKQNLEANELKDSGVHLLTSLAPLPADPDVILIKIPRTLALLEQQLIALRSVVKSSTRIIAAAKIKSITRSVQQLFEKYLGPTNTSLAKKKSRLLFCDIDAAALSQPVTSPYPSKWDMRCKTGQIVQVSNHANVFSRQSLDIGARLMIEHMQVDNQDSIIDLGCGNGALGLNALSIAPQAHVTFVDESYMALESAKENVLHNFPAQYNQCEFIASNCLESLLEHPRHSAVTKVVCNPPFHQQNVITDHIAWQMFSDAKAMLASGGHLIVVANRHLDYHNKLKRLYGGVKVLASDKKFVILSAAKR
ncbi:methyltransferase [Alteromonas pelagimontana]|uniref:Ribosomal RNA large subunit methyltransferase G n=1 Tax=Alteromonas pelagimontana TaxID=1858656 RepID=A0A6M4MAZ3_9ALTE|nr:methyltransferase [Alteromonas pelagimontana]QJR80364.1 methyltransferase [Alteromonas pelagimontana]